MVLVSSGALTQAKRAQRSTVCKKIWLNIHPRNWWWQKSRAPPPAHVSGCEMSHLLAKCPKRIQSMLNLIGHSCNDQLTAVKEGYLLTSVTYLYRWRRCTLSEMTCFLKAIRWLVIYFNWSQTQVQFLFRRNSVYFLLTAKVELRYLKNTWELRFWPWPSPYITTKQTNHNCQQSLTLTSCLRRSISMRWDQRRKINQINSKCISTPLVVNL